ALEHLAGLLGADGSFEELGRVADPATGHLLTHRHRLVELADDRVDDVTVDAFHADDRGRDLLDLRLGEEREDAGGAVASELHEDERGTLGARETCDVGPGPWPGRLLDGAGDDRGRLGRGRCRRHRHERAPTSMSARIRSAMSAGSSSAALMTSARLASASIWARSTGREATS